MQLGLNWSHSLLYFARLQIGRIVSVLKDSTHQGFPVVDGAKGVDVSTILLIIFEMY